MAFAFCSWIPPEVSPALDTSTQPGAAVIVTDPPTTTLPALGAAITVSSPTPPRVTTTMIAATRRVGSQRALSNRRLCEGAVGNDGARVWAAGPAGIAVYQPAGGVGAPSASAGAVDGAGIGAGDGSDEAVPVTGRAQNGGTCDTAGSLDQAGTTGVVAPGVAAVGISSAGGTAGESDDAQFGISRGASEPPAGCGGRGSSGGRSLIFG